MSGSVSESVDDNGNSVHPEVVNVSVNGLLVDDPEESIGSPQQSNKVGDSFRAESPGGSGHSTRKGFGLKKWRRIKRDGPVVRDEGATPVDDGSKLLKRGLTGLVNPPSKHVDLSSVEARQSSEGSVGSVNMVHHHHVHHPGVANGFSPDSGFMFTLGQAFEKGEEHSANTTAPKSVGGKVVSGISKKGGEERVKAKKDSDLRSSDFVFSSGAVSVANYGERDERFMNNHVGEFSKGQVQTYSRSENGDRDENGDESKKDNHYWGDKDLIADSIKNLAALQDALWKEVQSFQELGKESIPLHSDIDELSSSDQTRNENSAPSGSQVLIQKVKKLEHKLEEARAVLEAKEAKIQELENSRIEAELEGIFQRKIESEIEHLMMITSLKSVQVPEQPKKVHFVTEDPKPDRGNMLGKTYKLGFYLLTQMILLVSILRFLVPQYSPASSLVIPT